MERNLHNDDFEEFLKLKTDHYKLYPSEKVWKGIYQSIHTRKKWFQVGGSLLFLSALLFINYELKVKKPAPPAPQVTISSTAATATPKAAVPMRQNSIPKGIIASSVTRLTLPATRKNKALTADPLLIVEAGNLPASTEPARSTSLPSQQNEMKEAEAETGLTAEIIANTKDMETVSADVSDVHRPVANRNIDAAATEPIEKTEAGAQAEQRTPHGETDVNWLQEMAAIKLSSARRNRYNLQFYFSPTVSYRKLTDGEKSKDLSNVPLATNQLGVTNFVDHKPAIGLEIGSNVLFSPSKRLTLKTGLQLNYSRYTIKAYNFYYENAKIKLLTAGRISDTMSSYTSIRNFNGYFPEHLQNQYIQLSMPIGAEYKVLGTKRLQLNVAGSVQPTYLLYNDTYLLSTDFINYTKEPSLTRRWNVNTSAEAYVSYYIGSMRWQVGPQFRYQTLSSYVDRYPIKEYLFEYGVKIGVSKTLR